MARQNRARFRDVAIVHGTSHPELAREVSRLSGIPIIEAHVRQFANGEIGLTDGGAQPRAFDSSFKRKHVFVVVSPNGPRVNDQLMEAYSLASALKRHGASEITAVLPHFPYARQERITAERGPISARLVVDLLHAAGVHNIIATDLHAQAIQGFTSEQFENLKTRHVIYDHIRRRFGRRLKDVVFMGTDAGSAERNRELATVLNLPHGSFGKHRPVPNVSEVQSYIGPENLRGKHVVIFEDMIDTGGSILNVAKAVKEKGAQSVTVYATHGVFSMKDGKRAEDRLNESPHVDHVFVTSSLPVREEGKIKVIPLAPYLAKALVAHHVGGSFNSLMNFPRGRPKKG